MDTPNTSTLLERIRSRRLTATFTILATLSVGILIGSVLTNRVSGKEQQAVALWKVEGHTNEEIAERLGCVVRSVERKLHRIRIE